MTKTHNFLDLRNFILVLGRFPLSPSLSAFLLLGAGLGVFFSLLLLLKLKSPDTPLYIQAACTHACLSHSPSPLAWVGSAFLFSSPLSLSLSLSLSLPLSCILQLCISMAKGTGLDDSAGKEDPIVLDSNLTL